ncbi:hypothetical protein VNO77_11671 [Canavalia gladiata]|uniref:Uncharacterized protein n=1 Tax=Canavalia gladiata TaxID=3824 RepID=A0AAN9MHB1_CANGL
MGFRLPGIRGASLASSQAAPKAVEVPKGYFEVYVGEKMRRLNFILEQTFISRVTKASSRKHLNMIIQWGVLQFLAVRMCSWMSLLNCVDYKFRQLLIVLANLDKVHNNFISDLLLSSRRIWIFSSNGQSLNSMQGRFVPKHHILLAWAISHAKGD